MRKHLFVTFAVAAVAGAAQAQAPSGKADAEKLEAASENLSRMKASLKLVLNRAEQARNEKDVVKLNCVNEKLTQIKSLIVVAEKADLALHESVATKDPASDADSSKIAIARTKVDRLRGEAEQCVGQLAFNVEEHTTVEVEQPAGLAGGQGLGVAQRTGNPADAVTDIGFGVGTDTSGSWDRSFTPPTIVREPDASPYR